MKQIVFIGGRLEAASAGLEKVADQYEAPEAVIFYSDMSKDVWEALKNDLTYNILAEEMVDFNEPVDVISTLEKWVDKHTVINITGLPKETFAFLMVYIWRHKKDWHLVMVQEGEEGVIAFSLSSLYHFLKDRGNNNQQDHFSAILKYFSHILPDGIYQAELEKRLKRQKSTISGVLSSWERLGLIRREDRNGKIYVTVTPFGKKLYNFLRAFA